MVAAILKTIQSMLFTLFLNLFLGVISYFVLSGMGIDDVFERTETFYILSTLGFQEIMGIWILAFMVQQLLFVPIWLYRFCDKKE